MSFIFLFLFFLDRISFPLFLKCLLHYLSKLMYMGVYKYQCIEFRSIQMIIRIIRAGTTQM